MLLRKPSRKVIALGAAAHKIQVGITPVVVVGMSVDLLVTVVEEVAMEPRNAFRVRAGTISCKPAP